MYKLFKFLQDQGKEKMPFLVKLLATPNTLSAEELNIAGDLINFRNPPAWQGVMS